MVDPWAPSSIFTLHARPLTPRLCCLDWIELPPHRRPPEPLVRIRYLDLSLEPNPCPPCAGQLHGRLLITAGIPPPTHTTPHHTTPRALFLDPRLRSLVQLGRCPGVCAGGAGFFTPCIRSVEYVRLARWARRRRKRRLGHELACAGASPPGFRRAPDERGWQAFE